MVKNKKVIVLWLHVLRCSELDLQKYIFLLSKIAGKGTLSKPNILKPHQAKKSFGRDLFSFETIYAHLKSDALTAQWCAVQE